MKRLLPLLVVLVACAPPNLAGPTTSIPETSLSSRQADIETDNMVVELEDGVYVGYITSVSEDGAVPGRSIQFDLAVWFSGDAAEAAAAEDEDEPAPAGYYIRNQDPSHLVIPVSDQVAVTSAWYHKDSESGLDSQEISFDNLIEVWANTPVDARANMRNSPWWITVVDGTVVAIDEQYIP